MSSKWKLHFVQVSLKGTVIIIANHGDRIDIPAGAILENKIVSGNMRIMDHWNKISWLLTKYCMLKCFLETWFKNSLYQNIKLYSLDQCDSSNWSVAGPSLLTHTVSPTLTVPESRWSLIVVLIDNDHLVYWHCSASQTLDCLLQISWCSDDVCEVDEMISMFSEVLDHHHGILRSQD